MLPITLGNVGLNKVLTLRNRSLVGYIHESAASAVVHVTIFIPNIVKTANIFNRKKLHAPRSPSKVNKP